MLTFMNKTRKTLISLTGAAAVLVATAGAAPADVETGRTVSVLGTAAIDITTPESTFEISVHARGDGRSGAGVIWISHHNDEVIGWMVARVDCVRIDGGLGVVTAVVSDAEDFAVAGPGDQVALTVRDSGTKDRASFASREQAAKCQKSRDQEFEITRGDFEVHP